MKNTTCPFPANINPLSPNGFLFKIAKFSELEYFLQEVQLPGISLNPAMQSTTKVPLWHKGDTLSYEDLNVRFLIDSNMSNYKALHNWLSNLFPEEPDYEDIEPTTALLHILNKNGGILQTIQFFDIMPISLSGLSFTTITDDVQYLAGDAMFKYTAYKFL